MNEFLKFIVDNWVSLSSTIGMVILWFSKRKYDKVEFKKMNKRYRFDRIFIAKKNISKGGISYVFNYTKDL